jgi:hypothetical protein
MAKTPKTASGNRSRAKAARPEVTPLGKHLAALLNPALNERQPGVSEAPQAQYAHSRPLHHPPGMTGVAATVDSLKDLLERGDPNIQEKSPGRRIGRRVRTSPKAVKDFVLSPNSSPRAISRARSTNSSGGLKRRSATKCFSA